MTIIWYSPMKLECQAEIRESSTQDWYFVRITVNGRMYFDSPLMRLRIAEKTIDELRKVESKEMMPDGQLI